MILDLDDPIPPPTPPNESCVVRDPPPPYPSRDRRTRAARSARRSLHQIQTSHTQLSSGDSHSDHEVQGSPRTPVLFLLHDDEDTSENTPFLSPSTQRGTRRTMGRPRSYSHASTASMAPSLAHTVFSLFRTEEESEFEDDLERRLLLSPDDEHPHSSSRSNYGFFSGAAWGRYFRPMGQSVYWRPLFHLSIINFPFALAAWVYLFVFTVSGTTLLMALPLGALLCFFNLLGARAFARGELAMQIQFHSPLAHAHQYAPRPIFTRIREATAEELEAGSASIGGLVTETSFYKNSYAMFTDPTSYQAIFYFLVIKPSITLLFSLGLLIFVLPAIILVFPAPGALRATRRLGAWQANVAFEGLYVAVR